MGPQKGIRSSSWIKRAAGLLLLASGLVSMPFLLMVPYLAIFFLVLNIFLAGIYLLPWLLSFLAYLKGNYVISIVISIASIIIVGSASAYMVVQFISLRQPPKDGFLIPSESSFPSRFSALEMRQFTADRYEMDNYNPTNPGSDIRFSETTNSIGKQIFESSQETAKQNGGKLYSFTFSDSPGTVYDTSNEYHPTEGNVHYELFWQDGDKDLEIQYTGPRPDLTPEDMASLLKTLTRTVPGSNSPLLTGFLKFGNTVCNLSGIDVCVD